MNTIRVGINARTFCVDEPGGAVQAAMRMTRALADREDVEVVLFGHERVRELFPDLEVDTTGALSTSMAYGTVWERTVLPRRAELAGVDVLLCPNGNGPAFATPFPVVLWVHDVNAEQGMSSPVHGLYRRLTVPRAAHVADGIVTVSEFSKRELVDVLGVEPGRVDVVYNGIDETYLERARTDASELTAAEREAFDELELPNPYLLYVGAMNPRKNVGRLVKAFASMKDRTELPYDLVLVGPGNKSVFKNLALPERDDVITPGFVSEDALRGLYHHASGFVFPSLYEGFGIPPVEAMAMGVPVLVSTAAALPEVCGDAAAYVDPTDTAALDLALEDLIADAAALDLGIDDLREESAEVVARIARGRTRAAEFSWENAAATLADCCRRVVDEHASEVPVSVPARHPLQS